MEIHLPEDLERFVRDQVRTGRFPTEDDVVRDALERSRRQGRETAPSSGGELGSIGAMRDDAELLDQVVADAMRIRRERPLRLAPGE